MNQSPDGNVTTLSTSRLEIQDDSPCLPAAPGLAPLVLTFDMEEHHQIEAAWALDVLAELGLVYDSSIYPVRHDRYGVPDAPRGPFLVLGSEREILELPPNAARADRRGERQRERQKK
jgi:hypothetical protein